jgi:NADH-quinone oxidoreductase subunit C
LAEIYEKLAGEFPGKVTYVDPVLVVEAASIAEMGTWLRDAPELAFDTLHCLSGVDYPAEERIEVVYHLFSLKHRHWLVLKVDLPRANAKLPTVENVWKTANWHEREAFDLLGIVFEGHSDPRRILLPEDWPGHPLRKDWEWPDQWHGIPVKPGKQLVERAKEGEQIGTGPPE